MDMQVRTWNLDERFPNLLLDLNPATQFEMKTEYIAIYADLAGIYHPEGLTEQHCLEMMATAMWCERRAISAETSALNLDYKDQADQMQRYRASRPEGYTAAEQTAFAIDHVVNHDDFYNFLLRYKRTQTLFYESNLRRLHALKKDRLKYEPQLAETDNDQYESSASLRHRLEQYDKRDLQNERDAA